MPEPKGVEFISNVLSIQPLGTERPTPPEESAERPEIKPPYKKILQFSGNEELRSLFLEEFLPVQALPVDDPSRKERLEKLVKRLEALRLTRQGEEILDDKQKEMGIGYSEDITALLQMAYAELTGPPLDPELKAATTESSKMEAKIEVSIKEIMDSSPQVQKFRSQMGRIVNTLSTPAEVIDPEKLLTLVRSAVASMDEIVALMHKHYGVRTSEKGTIPADTAKLSEVEAFVHAEYERFVPDDKSGRDFEERMAEKVFSEWKKRFEEKTENAELFIILRERTPVVLLGKRVDVVIKFLEQRAKEIQQLQAEMQLPVYKKFLENILNQIYGEDKQGGRIKELIDHWEEQEKNSHISNPDDATGETYVYNEVVKSLSPGGDRYDTTPENARFARAALSTFEKQKDSITNTSLRQRWENLLEKLRPLVKRIEEAVGSVKEAHIGRIDLDWLMTTLDDIEAAEYMLSDAHEIITGLNFIELQSHIKKHVTDVAERTRLLNILNARVHLHDAALNFVIARYFIDTEEGHRGIDIGYTALSPQDFETLFHEIPGCEDLVPIALSLYELALKGRLPGVQSKAWNWNTIGGPAAAEKIESLLGKNGALASKLANRLVTCTGMPSYYEEDFLRPQKDEMRDVMHMEPQRFYYGDPARVAKAGLRAHGFTGTVKKYFSVKGEVNPSSKKPYDPVLEIPTEQIQAGEPVWDLISDFWNYASLIEDPSGEIIKEHDKLITLSRFERFHPGEKPDFTNLVARGILTPAQVTALQAIDWSGVVNYQRMHFKPHSRGGRTVKIKDNAYTEWVDQMKNRKALRNILTKTGWSANDFTQPHGFENIKTTFDYLVNSGNVLRDLPKTEQDKNLRAIQTTFLWPIIRNHSPAFVPVENAWKTIDLYLIIFTAQSIGFITQEQADFLLEAGGLTGLISAADRAQIASRARRIAGLPGQ